MHHKNYWHIWGKISFILEIKFSLALQPEALVNTSGQVLLSRSLYYLMDSLIFLDHNEVNLGLTLFILDTSKQVLWQTVKTQMK